jgi:hypothetical protein
MAGLASTSDSGWNCAKRPKAAVDPDARIVASRALAGLFPAKILVRHNLMVWSAMGYCTRVALKDRFGCIS